MVLYAIVRHHLFQPNFRMTKIGCISMNTSNKDSVTNVFQDAICDARDPCHAMSFFLSTVTSIRNIHKITKIRISETLNRIESDIEDSTVQGWKYRENELISREVSTKRRGIQKKKLIDTQCESNINIVCWRTSLIRKYG